MRVFFVMALAAFIGCTENLEVNNMENEVDISGLKLHYAQKCGGVDVKVYYSPKVEFSYVTNYRSLPFDKYKIILHFKDDKRGARKVEYLSTFGYQNIKIFQHVEKSIKDITSETIGSAHIDSPAYIDITTQAQRKGYFEAYPYTGLFTSIASGLSERGKYSVKIIDNDMLKVNGVPCAIDVPNIPIEVVPDGSI